MTKLPENQIHHLKESLEENALRAKIPWIMLLSFILLAIVGILIYSYNYRDLPKCQDEAVQILLNQNIRSNEVLIQNSRTLAFEGSRESTHNNQQRFCIANLITNQGNYQVNYLVQDDLIEKGWLSRLTGAVQYSVAIEKIQPIK